MWIFPMAAAAVAAVFALLITRQWLARHKPHHLAWAIALAMFAVGSFAAAAGLLGSWSGGLYRTFYFFGAIANVPVLGLGTMFLSAPKRVATAFAVVVAAALIYAAGATFTAQLNGAGLATRGVPRAGEVLPGQLRDLSRIYSYTGFFIVLGGALWSAWRLSRTGDEALRRIAGANVLIAAGAFVAGVASGFARFGRGSVLGVGLLAGISLMFAGFLKSKAPAPGGRSRRRGLRDPGGEQPV